MSGVYIEICREVWYNNLTIIAARPQAAAGVERGCRYGNLCSGACADARRGIDQIVRKDAAAPEHGKWAKRSMCSLSCRTLLRKGTASERAGAIRRVLRG